MANSFTFYKAGIVFWAVSLVLFFAGILILPGYAIQSVMLILTAIASFILGGLSIIYAELRKPAK